MAAAEAERLCLTDLPGELLELILCCDVLGAADIGRVACTCRRLREACQPRGQVWRERFRLRWAARGGGRRAGPVGGAGLALRPAALAGPGAAHRGASWCSGAALGAGLLLRSSVPPAGRCGMLSNCLI